MREEDSFLNSSNRAREAEKGQGAKPLAGFGAAPQAGFGALPQKPSEENGVSEQAAKQPTIETGWICKARIRLQISKGLYIVLSAPAFQ